MKYKVRNLEGEKLDAAVAHVEGFVRHTVDCAPNAQWLWRDPAARYNGIPFYNTTSAQPGTDEWAEQIVWRPSSNWAQGGRIIERERIAVYFAEDPWPSEGPLWIAGYAMRAEAGTFYSEETGSDEPSLSLDHSASGITPLVAAMRAYVASKFGEEVELP